MEAYTIPEIIQQYTLRASCFPRGYSRFKKQDWIREYNKLPKSKMQISLKDNKEKPKEIIQKGVDWTKKFGNLLPFVFEWLCIPSEKSLLTLVEMKQKGGLIEQMQDLSSVSKNFFASIKQCRFGKKLYQKWKFAKTQNNNIETWERCRRKQCGIYCHSLPFFQLLQDYDSFIGLFENEKCYDTTANKILCLGRKHLEQIEKICLLSPYYNGWSFRVTVTDLVEPAILHFGSFQHYLDYQKKKKQRKQRLEQKRKQKEKKKMKRKRELEETLHQSETSYHKLEDVLTAMEEMKFYDNHTEYKSILNDLYIDIEDERENSLLKKKRQRQNRKYTKFESTSSEDDDPSQQAKDKALQLYSGPFHILPVSLRSVWRRFHPEEKQAEMRSSEIPIQNARKRKHIPEE
jgi:hypothetical protein